MKTHPLYFLIFHRVTQNTLLQVLRLYGNLRIFVFWKREILQWRNYPIHPKKKWEGWRKFFTGIMSVWKSLILYWLLPHLEIKLLFVLSFYETLRHTGNFVISSFYEKESLPKWKIFKIRHESEFLYVHVRTPSNSAPRPFPYLPTFPVDTHSRLLYPKKDERGEGFSRFEMAGEHCVILRGFSVLDESNIVGLGFCGGIGCNSVMDMFLILFFIRTEKK